MQTSLLRSNHPPSPPPVFPFTLAFNYCDHVLVPRSFSLPCACLSLTIGDDSTFSIPNDARRSHLAALVCPNHGDHCSFASSSFVSHASIVTLTVFVVSAGCCPLLNGSEDRVAHSFHLWLLLQYFCPSFFLAFPYELSLRELHHLATAVSGYYFLRRKKGFVIFVAVASAAAAVNGLAVSFVPHHASAIYHHFCLLPACRCCGH